VSTVTVSPDAPPAAHARTRGNRLTAAVPLLTLYIWLCTIYVIEAWKHVTPWLFGDELELTQLSRSIAETGHAARRGVAHTPDSLYTYLTAPMWWINDVATAYAGIKYLDVFVMTSVVFPTYLLARLIVRRPAALFAAAGAGVIPSLAYSSWIVEETLAYPYAAWSMYLIAKALVERRAGSRHSRAWTAAAVLSALLGPAVRGELIVLPIVLVLALFFAFWSTDAARKRRATWSLADWAGTILLAFGAIFVISGVLSHQSQEWYGVTTFYKHRSLIMGNWAVGALAIGIGVVPLIAGLASLFRIPGEQPSRELRMVRSVMLAGLIGFGLYTALKSAYLSTQFATRVEERNLIYVAPLLFVGTALVLERRRVNLWALAAAAAYTLYLLGYALYHAVGSPYEMGVQLYSDSLGFAILQGANRYLYLDTTDARILLVGVVVFGTAVVVAPRWLAGRGRLAAGLTAGLALLVLGWSLTGQIAAAAGTVSISRSAANTLRHPFTWVDAVTQGKPTLYMGQGETDPNPENLIEFWNRSIVTVSSLDGSVGGPGPAGGPNLSADGRLLWDRQYPFAVEDWPCVEFAGALRAQHAYSAGGTTRTWRLLELAQPNRLQSMCTGLYADSWTGPNDAAYFRFAKGKPGWLRVLVSRRNWSGPSDPSPVHLLVGKLVVNANHAPVLGRVTNAVDLTIDSGQSAVCWLRTPSARFAAHVVVDKKFVPHDVFPKDGDVRTLGAETHLKFFSERPRGMRSTCR
jgi:uncharacterized membrane protein